MRISMPISRSRSRATLLSVALVSLFFSQVYCFAAVEAAWQSCFLHDPQHNAQKCMCNPVNFENLAFAMLADGPGLFQLWTGIDGVCDAQSLAFFHGAPGQGFLAFPSWMYVYGQRMNVPAAINAAKWMVVDPMTDGVSLWAEGNGGIEGRGFQPQNLYTEIVPMASGLDSYLFGNNTCGFDEIVARAFAPPVFDMLLDVWQYAVDHGQTDWGPPQAANFTRCIKAWQSMGISQWMSAFVLHVNQDDGLAKFARYSRFSNNDVWTARTHFEATVNCANVAYSNWKNKLDAKRSSPALVAVQSAQEEAESCIRRSMQKGICGPPPYHDVMKTKMEKKE